MKIKETIITLILGLCTKAAFAQTPETPPAQPVPAAAAPAPAVPPAASVPTAAEGTLFKTQRSRNDKGKYEWTCTYAVANLKRSVLLDESCPTTMQFELKR